MDVRQKLGQVRGIVENARSMPMSASCVLNRDELLAALSELEGMLPAELGQAQQLLANRTEILERGRAEAARLVEEGKRQREALIHDTDVHRAAEAAAAEVRERADREAEELRRETDDYVDQKLAGFEIALQKTLASTHRGRERLAGMRPNDRGGNPAQRREVDEFVIQKLDRFEESLHRSLESVSRGRERLRDRSRLDDYGTEEVTGPLPN